MFYLLIFAAAAASSVALTPLAMAVGRRLDLVDRPGGRRRHQGTIPRTGGLAMVAAFCLTVSLALLLPLLLPESLAGWFPARDDPQEMRRLAALLGGSLFCAVAGFLDDRQRWGPLRQYLVQAAAGLIAMAGLIFLKHVNNPFAEGFLFGPDGFPWWLVWPLTLFWFMGMMNTVNFLDGLSGLVAGVTAILCGVLAVHMLFAAQPPQLSVAILPVALLGATLGFLPYNFAPARVFMGSSGSYFLGFAVAALGFIGGARLATVVLVLGLPILDVAWLIVSRWRSGRSPSEGGRDHLHFRLLDMGHSERAIVIAYWLFCACFGLLTLFLSSRSYKLVALIGLGLVAIGVLTWAARGRPTPPPVEK